MLFDPTDDQRDFQASARGLLARAWTPRELRLAWQGESGAARKLWTDLAALGLFGITIGSPEEVAPGSRVALALALEEIGYAGYPGPVMESAAVVAPALSTHRPSSQWLQGLLDGTTLAAVSLDKRAPVAYGERAEVTLVVRGGQVHLVPAEAASWLAMPSQDPTRALAFGTFEMDRHTLLVDDQQAADQVRAATWTGTANLLVGISQRLIDMTRAYLLEREQFGMVIGKFQALKHRIADCAVAVEAARGLGWYAAYALEADPERALLAARTAKASASDAASLTNKAALQLHGGIGFTWEHDLHLWLKPGQALERSHGTAADHRLAIGTELIALAPTSRRTDPS